MLALNLVAVEANWGSWKVRCSRCPSALTVDRFAPVFDCCECGMRAEIVWPSEAMTFSIERLLLMRPDPTTQNWVPGETLIDLMYENGTHGIFTDVPGELIVDEKEIRMDSLPATRKPELKAVG